MSLLELQRRFREEIVSGDDDAAPSSTGMAVYRQAYRNRLLECLEATFEKTRRWTGEAAFSAAARHHILTHPPCSWTLDDYGADFPATLAELFQGNPEVAELAWIEGEMQRVFAMPDEPVFTSADLQKLAERKPDWDTHRFDLRASVSLRTARTACGSLWLALERNEMLDELPHSTEPFHILVWRNELSSQFRIVETREGQALEHLREQRSFGDLCALLNASAGEEMIAQLGEWLLRWIDDGLIADPAARV